MSTWTEDQGTRMLVCRVRAGMSQVEVARRMGVSQPMVSRVENGLCTPNVEWMTRYAAALGMPARLLILLPDED